MEGMDGASSNQGFSNILLSGTNLLMSEYHFTNLYYLTKKMFIIMDIKHLIKKLRNNASSSNIDGKRRCLTHQGKLNVFQHWEDGYRWDQGHTFPLHYKLKREHLNNTNIQTRCKMVLLKMFWETTCLL